MSPRPFLAVDEDKRKTRQQLLEELAGARARIAALTEAQSERESILRAFNGVAEPFFILDDNSVITFANTEAEALFGTGGGGLEGRSLWDVYPQNREWFDRFYGKAREKREPVRFRETRKLMNRWFEISLYPMPEGTVVHFHDITSREQIEAVYQLALKLINNLKESIFTMRADGRLFHVNEEASTALGYASADLIRMSIAELVPQEDMSTWTDALRRIKQQGSMTFESKFRARDGRVFPVEVYANYFYLHGASYYTVSARDITERKAMVEILEKYRLFSENARDIVLFVRRDGHILEANEAATKAYGYTREELLSLSVYDLRATDPGYHVDMQMDTAFDKGVLFEALHRRKDGSTFPVEVSSLGKIIDGNKVLLSVVRDITDRKLAEEALRKSEEKFRLLADFTYDWESWIGPEGKYVYVSPSCERITGHGADEFYRDPGLLIKLVHPDDRAAYEHHQNVHLGGTPGNDSIDFRIVTASGETRWISHLCRPVFGSNGEWLGRRSGNRDITERKQAEEALRAAKAQAELYVDLMGHDINNMNHIAMSSLEVALMELERAGKLDASGISLLEKSMKSLTSSSQLIRNVQKLQRASTEGVSLKAIDATGVLESVINQFRQAPGKELTIDFSRTGDCLVSANELLKDVFINLIGNAIKHSHHDRSLIIGISADNVVEYGRKHCRFVIEDNGPGIPDDMKAKLFQRFSRGQTKAKGSGLGLYLVKTLVEHYGGDIRVEDRIPGDYTKGAKFIVTLPAAE